ncbi:MAG TPA: DUF6429 family protein [Bacteroidota bacterium]|nr:DUF6429 family protein [Bacteroidota bacterium]
MDIDTEKVDDAVLALLFLTSFENHGIVRAWKTQSWDVMNRLFEKGYMSDPRNKAKSILFTDEGRERSKELFERLFCK